MNELFEKLSDVFEELRSQADEREYSIQTEEAKKADKELKKANREYEKFLSELSAEQRKLYGYCISYTLSGAAESLLSGYGRCSTDTCRIGDC